MQITLNGEKKEVPDGMSVMGLLALLGIQHQRVAVELNETIVKKDRYAETGIKHGDSLEVVAFMGGGGTAAGGIEDCKVQIENCKLTRSAAKHS